MNRNEQRKTNRKKKKEEKRHRVDLGDFLLMDTIQPGFLSDVHFPGRFSPWRSTIASRVQFKRNQKRRKISGELKLLTEIRPRNKN